MDISEVEDVLSRLRLLGALAPKHVLITDEPIIAKVNGAVLFKGLCPAGESVVVLSRHADASTIPHEIVHTLGLGELAAEIISKIATARLKLMPSKPIRRVKYVEVDDVPAEYKGRIRHYVRVD